MTLEQHLIVLLNPLFPGEAVFWDTAPDGFNHRQGFAILQLVGGREKWYVDKATNASHYHQRVRVMVWQPDRLSCSAKMREVADAIRVNSSVSEPYGAAVSGHDDAIKMHSSRRDFGIWYPFDP